MKTNQPLFVGYGSLEEWAASIDPKKQVFADLVTETGRTGQYNIRSDQIVIVAVQPANDLVHYCRLVVGQVSYVGGKPFDSDHEQRLALASQAWEVVHDWLIAKGLTVRKAVIATPKDLKFMDGWAEFLVFDNELQAYRRV